MKRTSKLFDRMFWGAHATRVPAKPTRLRELFSTTHMLQSFLSYQFNTLHFGESPKLGPPRRPLPR